jgi:hypothetical protein
MDNSAHSNLYAYSIFTSDISGIVRIKSEMFYPLVRTHFNQNINMYQICRWLYDISRCFFVITTTTTTTTTITTATTAAANTNYCPSL